MDKNKINKVVVSDFVALLKNNEELGSFWYRFGAFAIDSVIVYITGLILISLLSINFIDPKSFLLLVIYSSILLSLWSTTIGKKLFGLRVVDQKTGQRIGIIKAIIRSLLYFVSLLFIGVGFLMIAGDKKNRQGLHDKLAKTLVLRDKNKDLKPAILASIIAIFILLYANIYDTNTIKKKQTVHDGICPPTVTDIDNNNYKTVQIGSQCWMKENLKVTKNPAGKTITRYCYNNEINICNTDGGLYTWDTATDNSEEEEGMQGICPDGWHVPTDAEWYILESGLADGSCSSNRGEEKDDSLSRISKWGCDPAGTKLKQGGSSGFDAIFAGYINSNGTSINRSTDAAFWVSLSSIKNPQYSLLFPLPLPWSNLDRGSRAWSRNLDSSHTAIARFKDSSSEISLSVRCLKD